MLVVVVLLTMLLHKHFSQGCLFFFVARWGKFREQIGAILKLLPSILIARFGHCLMAVWLWILNGSACSHRMVSCFLKRSILPYFIGLMYKDSHKTWLLFKDSSRNKASVQAKYYFLCNPLYRKITHFVAGQRGGICQGCEKMYFEDKVQNC